MFTIVTGCPRSGTSLCMDIHREVYGEDRIYGKKFPQELDLEGLDQLEVYYRKKSKLVAEQRPGGKRDYKDMNPEGFWECEFTTTGVIYRFRLRDIFAKAKKQSLIVKVVSQGLLSSDPTYIKNIVYMSRHPRAVAKSQERLGRDLYVKGKDGKDVNLYDFKVHSPEMYVKVTIDAMVFFNTYRHIPLKIVDFDDLMTDPVATIEHMDLQGDTGKAIQRVNPKLNRSKHEDIPNTLWSDAEYLYQTIGKFSKLKTLGEDDKAYVLLEKAFAFIQNPKREIQLENTWWRCYRTKEMTRAAGCERCMTNVRYRKAIRSDSEAQKSEIAEHYMFEPCAFECGKDVKRKTHLTLEQSVDNNFWEHDEPLNLGDIRS